MISIAVRAPSILFAVALALFCANSSGAQTMSVRDSAGMRIVTHRGIDTLKSVPELALTLVAKVGGAGKGGNYEFTNMGDASILRDGGFVVPSGPEIRLFDAEGGWIRSVGHTGAGPGEFGMVSRVCALPDGSVLGFDAPGRRIALFDKSGGVSWSATATPLFVGCLSDGSLLVSSPAASTRMPPLPRDFAMVVASDTAVRYSRYSRVAMDASLRFLGDVALVKLPASSPLVRRVSPTGANLLVSATRPFASIISVDAAPDRVCVGEARVFEVRCHDIKSGTTLVLRVERGRQRVTDDHKRQFLDQLLANISAQDRPTRIREIESSGFPETMPPYGAVRCDDAGRIWIKHFTPPGAATQQWNVFRATGEHIGTVKLPADLTVLDVRHGRILARGRDADGFAIANVFALGG